MAKVAKDSTEKSGSGIDVKDIVSSVMKEFKDQHYNNIVTPKYKVSSGSLNFDAKLGGGISPGLIRFTGASEAGKAQPLDSQVFTPDGKKNIGDLKIGDKIYGSAGTLTTVLNVFPQGKRMTYKISFSDDTHTYCCLEHLWLVYPASDSDHGRGPYVRSTKEIKEKLNYGDRSNFSIDFCKPVQFPKRNLQIDPYVMGVLLGDGHLSSSGQVSFTLNDISIVNNVEKRLPEECQVNITNQKSGRANYYRICRKTQRTPSNPVIESIRYYGLSNSRSFDKFIPEDYLYSSIEDRIDLLRGLMDTDGYAPHNRERKRGGVVYYTTSKELKDGVCFLVRSLGGSARVNCKEKPTYVYKNEKRIGRPCYVINISFGNDINPFLLERKSGLYTKAFRRQKKYIVGVDEHKEEECVCIQVDAPDSLYLTDDFIATHNTSSALTFLQNFLSEKENRYGVYIDAECRLNDKIKSRVNVKFVENIEEFVEGTCFVLTTTSYNMAIQLMRQLVTANQGTEKRFFFILDSIDCLIPDETAATNAEDVNQIAGMQKAVLTTRFLERFGAAMRKNGHIGAFISQVRIKMTGQYVKADPNAMTASSGANSLVHSSDLTLEFLHHRSQKDLFVEKVNGEDKIIGHTCKIALRKTQNDTTSETVEYPVRRNAPRGQSIWVEKEILDRLLSFGKIARAGAWYKMDESIINLLKENNIECEEKYQGEDAFVTFLDNNKEATKILYKYIIEVLNSIYNEYD